MILTVGNTKGGVGKTTLSVGIAITLARRGFDVWLVDADRQGTAQTAISIRAEASVQPGIACSSYPDGPALRGQVQQQCASGLKREPAARCAHQSARGQSAGSKNAASQHRRR